MAMMDDESMDDLPADAEVTMDAGGMDIGKLAAVLREMADKISQLQAMLPADAGQEQADNVDEATEDAQEAEDAGPQADSGKADAKSRAALMIAKQLG